jgi:hypothetical protein
VDINKEAGSNSRSRRLHPPTAPIYLNPRDSSQPVAAAPGKEAEGGGNGLTRIIVEKRPRADTRE